MYAVICGKTVAFEAPGKNEKTVLKNWVSGIPDKRLRALVQDEDRQTLCRLEPTFHPPTGQYQAKPQTFQHGNEVYTAWVNFQPDKYRRAGRYGYTLVVKHLYQRQEVRKVKCAEAEAETVGA